MEKFFRAQAFKGGVILVILPLLNILATLGLFQFAPDFWVYGTSVLVTIFSLFVEFQANKKISNHFLEKAPQAFLRIVIVATGSFCLLALTILELVGRTVPKFLLIANGFALLMTVIYLVIQLKEENQSYTGISKIVVVSMISLTINVCYAYFATQWIWFPVLGLVAVLCYFADEPTMKHTYEQYALMTMAFSPLSIGIISTVYQFWFTTIYGDFLLWHTFAGAGVLILLYLLWLLGVKVKKDNREKEENRLAKIKRDKEEAQQKALIDGQVGTVTTKVLSDSVPSWKDIIFLDKNGGTGKIKHRIPLADLTELVDRSAEKTQFFWGQGFERALNIVESEFRLEHKDPRILEISQQMEKLMDFVNAERDFFGHTSITQLIKRNCPSYFDYLRNKEERAKKQ